MESRYVKDTSSRFMVKFVKVETNEIILQIPITPMESIEYFKSDYVKSVMKNTFGEARLAEIGDIIVLIDQQYNFVA